MMGRDDWTPGMVLERMIYDRGETKEEFANRSGLSRQTVYNMCNDKGATANSWKKAADALGMELSRLIEKVRL